MTIYYEIKELVLKEKYSTWIPDPTVSGAWINNLETIQNQKLLNLLIDHKDVQFSSGHPSKLSRENVSKNKYGAITVKSRIALYAFVPKD